MEEKGNVFQAFKVYTDKRDFVKAMPDATAGRLFKQMFDCYMSGAAIVPKEEDHLYEKALFKEMEQKILDQRERDLNTSAERRKAINKRWSKEKETTEEPP